MKFTYPNIQINLKLPTHSREILELELSILVIILRIDDGGISKLTLILDGGKCLNPPLPHSYSFSFSTLPLPNLISSFFFLLLLLDLQKISF